MTERELTRAQGRAITTRYLWRLSVMMPPALRLLVLIPHVANDTDWSPLGGAA